MASRFAIVPPDWSRELAEITAITLEDFRKQVIGEAFTMLAVKCRPADGWISLSMLLAAEAAADPALADPARTSSWRHEGFERKTGMWRLAAGVERVMQESYHCADEPERPEVHVAFVRACGEVMNSARVRSALDAFGAGSIIQVESLPAGGEAQARL